MNAEGISTFETHNHFKPPSLIYIYIKDLESLQELIEVYSKPYKLCTRSLSVSERIFWGVTLY